MNIEKNQVLNLHRTDLQDLIKDLIRTITVTITIIIMEELDTPDENKLDEHINTNMQTYILLVRHKSVTYYMFQHKHIL